MSIETGKAEHKQKFMKNRYALIIGTILTAQTAGAGQTGTWGDQGDGIYKNSILESNYPDIDVIREGDTFKCDYDGPKGE